MSATPERAAREGDQQLPTEGRGDVILSLVRSVPAQLLERRATGVRRYGRPLETWNGRDAHRDLREELLDALAYSEQAAQERADLEVELAAARADVARLSAALGQEQRLRGETEATWEAEALRLAVARDEASADLAQARAELALEVAARKALEERLGLAVVGG